MIVNLDDVKEHLNQTLAIDDNLIERKAKAAQEHLESLLGYKIEEVYTSPSEIPLALKEAVCQLAALWYGQREAAVIGVSAQALPMGFDDIVANNRNYSFGGDDEDDDE